MFKLVNGIKQHGKEFEEMNKVSSVDQIRLRNSKMAEAPVYPKPYKKQSPQRVSFGAEAISTNGWKVIQDTL